MIRWVLLDRDGTLCERHHYLVDPEQVTLLPGVAPGLQLLHEYGLRFVVITNQSVIGRAVATELDVLAVHMRLEELLKCHKIPIASVLLCPHTPEDQCACRKPRPGLLELAGDVHEFQPEECVFIGDSCSDIEAGKAWGCRTIGLSGPLLTTACNPSRVASDLVQAANIILEWNRLGPERANTNHM